MKAKKEMVHLISVYPPEDDIIAGLLTTAGIFIHKKWEAIAPIEGLRIGPLAEVHLYVPKEQLEEAKKILSSAQNT